MNKKDIYAAISRHLTKTKQEHDDEILHIWTDKSEENKSMLESIEHHWNSPSQRKISILNSDEVKKSIWNKANKQPSYNINSAKKTYFNYLKYAAVLTILIISGIVIYFQIDKDEIVQSTSLLISKSNNAGRKSTIHLNDGTVVNLNAESKIEYYDTFSDTARFIWLTGEAFFEVAHDKSKPFYVVSQGVAVKALGTSFNVSAFPDNEVVKVSLATGKVLIKSYDSVSREYKSDEIVLLPGQEISFQKNASIFSAVTTYNEKEVEGWKNGILYFKLAGLEEIITKLNRWYGVEIQVDSVTPSYEISYTGVFEKQNLNNVLASIGFVTNFDFKINDKNVMLNFKEK